LVWSARKSAFSAPWLCTVAAGCLAWFMSEPACAMSRAPTSSPTMVVRFGAMLFMRFARYSASVERRWQILGQRTEDRIAAARLIAFDLIPVAQHLAAAFDLDFAKDVRMAADQLLAAVVGDLAEVADSSLLKQ
jgi:hypothetical protein